MRLDRRTFQFSGIGKGAGDINEFLWPWLGHGLAGPGRARLFTVINRRLDHRAANVPTDAPTSAAGDSGHPEITGGPVTRQAEDPGMNRAGAMHMLKRPRGSHDRRITDAYLKSRSREITGATFCNEHNFFYIPDPRSNHGNQVLVRPNIHPFGLIGN